MFLLAFSSSVISSSAISFAFNTFTTIVPW